MTDATTTLTLTVAEIGGLVARFGVEDSEKPSPAAVTAFLDAMYVRSIWASPESKDSFLHVDYTIDDDETQYVLSVAMNRRGAVTGVEMES